MKELNILKVKSDDLKKAAARAQGIEKSRHGRMQPDRCLFTLECKFKSKIQWVGKRNAKKKEQLMKRDESPILPGGKRVI